MLEPDPASSWADAGQTVRLRYGAGDSGRIRVRACLTVFDANGWTVTTRHRSRLTIRPGERMRKLWPKSRG